MILSICDPMASIVGKQFRLGPYKVFGNTKTAIGSLAFFLTALIICLLGFYWFPFDSRLPLALVCVLLCLISTGMEAVSVIGWDNFTVPMSVLAILFLSIA